MSKKEGYFWAFVAGALTGAALGILYAPDKGKNTRDKLSFQLEKYREQLKQLIQDLTDGKTEAVTEAKSEGQRVVSDAVKQAERLMGEVDALRNQLSRK